MQNGAVVFIAQKPIRQMNVALRGAWAAMPEQFLERGDREFGFSHSSAERMAQLVTGDMNARLVTIFFQYELDAGDG